MRIHLGSAGSLALPAILMGMLLGCQSNEGTIEVGLAVSGQALTGGSIGVDAGSVASDAGVAGPHLFLSVARVDVHVTGDGSPDDDDPPGGLSGSPPSQPNHGGWVTVVTGGAQVDLLDTASIETILGSAATPSGKVTQIRLILSGATWVDGASMAPVTCPSCTQTGLKIVTMGKLFVQPGGTLHVTLDLDREHSIRSTSEGYHLDPVIKIARADTR